MILIAILALVPIIAILFVYRSYLHIRFDGMLTDAESKPLLPAHGEGEYSEDEGFCSKCGAALVQDEPQSQGQETAFTVYWQNASQQSQES